VASKFKDRLGDEWELAVTVADLPDLKEVGFDAGKMFDEKDGLAARMAVDPGLVVRAVYVLCEKQAESRGITPEAFARLFDGNTFGRAVEALTAEVAAFFPISTAGRVLSRNAPAVFAAEERAMEAELAKHLNHSTSNGSAGNSPVSSGASIPAP
jgi:hypothetical protein